MDKLNLATALSGDVAQELETAEFPGEQAQSEIRPLGDWEMALVGGGENVPNW